MRAFFRQGRRRIPSSFISQEHSRDVFLWRPRTSFATNTSRLLVGAPASTCAWCYALRHASLAGHRRCPRFPDWLIFCVLRTTCERVAARKSNGNYFVGFVFWKEEALRIQKQSCGAALSALDSLLMLLFVRIPHEAISKGTTVQAGNFVAVYGVFFCLVCVTAHLSIACVV